MQGGVYTRRCRFKEEEEEEEMRSPGRAHPRHIPMVRSPIPPPPCRTALLLELSVLGPVPSNPFGPVPGNVVCLVPEAWCAIGFSERVEGRAPIAGM